MATGDSSVKENIMEAGDNDSEEDQKLLDLFHSMSRQGINTVEDFTNLLGQNRLLRSMEEMKVEDVDRQPEDHDGTYTTRHHGGNTDRQHGSYGSYHYPRLSTFGGDSGKGEVNWECFKFEVRALVADGVCSQEQIMHGIRKAVKGEVSEILRRLGTEVTVQEVLDKLQATYGNIESKETVMKSFYNCTQFKQESVTSYAIRLEEFFDRAVQLGAMERKDTMTLKCVLYQGLNKDLKHRATYKCETIKDYDRFKIELRKIESEINAEQQTDKPLKTCNAAISIERQRPKEIEEKSDLKEMKDLLKQLNARIQKLEDQKDQQDVPLNLERGYRRGFNREYRGNTRGVDRGHGYRPRRPWAGNTFMPRCFKCQETGHMKRDCPN